MFDLQIIALFALLPILIGSSDPGSHVSRDYDKLTHTITLTAMRAGNHDESGQNDYYFSIAQYALINTKEERLKELSDRKKEVVAVGEFGSISLPSLAYWKPDKEDTQGTSEESNPFEFTLTGQSIRTLVANTMHLHNLSEDWIAHMVEIRMMERNKKFIFFGDDQEVAKTHYFPIPPTTFDVPERVNQTLTIQDDKGTIVKLSVRYENPVIRQAGETSTEKTGKSR